MKKPETVTLEYAQIGYSGPVPVMLAGYRGPYNPRTPLLIADVEVLERRRLEEEVKFRKWHERMSERMASP